LPAFDDKDLNLGWFLATSKALSRQASVAELADAPDSARRKIEPFDNPGSGGNVMHSALERKFQ